MVILPENELLILGYRYLTLKDLVPGNVCYFVPFYFSEQKKHLKEMIKAFTPAHARYRIFQEWRDDYSLHVTHPNTPDVPHNTYYDVSWLLSGRYIVPCCLILEGMEW